MFRDVITESTDLQLTTTSAVKAALGTTSTDDDALLDRLISEASRWAEGEVGYPLVARRYLELTAGMGSRRMLLSATPIRAMVNGPFSATDTGSATELATSEFRLNREAGIVDRDQGFAWDAPYMARPFGLGITRSPWGGQENTPWRHDYVAGYTYAGIASDSALYSTRAGTTSTGRTLPYDIEGAVIEKVIGLYEGSDGVAEKAVGDLRVRYGSYGDSVITDAPTKTLMRYRRVS